MRYLINKSTDPYFNMALDEWALENLDLSGGPVFYLWRNSPSVIIGLNQNPYAEVNLDFLASRDIKLARRVTGGGAVYHDLQNLNYTFIRNLGASSRFDSGPTSASDSGSGSDSNFFSFRIQENCNGKDLVELMSGALASLGVRAEVGGRNDLNVNGMKVSGFARRVWRDREIVHGTLMYNVDIDTLTSALAVRGSKLETKGVASVRSRVANLCDYLPEGTIEDFQASLHSILAGTDKEIILTDKDLRSVRQLADTKFATREWLLGRRLKSASTSPLPIAHSAPLPTESIGASGAQLHYESSDAPGTQLSSGPNGASGTNLPYKQSEAAVLTAKFKGKFNCGEIIAHIEIGRGLLQSLIFEGDFIGGLPACELADILIGHPFTKATFSDLISHSHPENYFEGLTTDDLLSLFFPHNS